MGGHIGSIKFQKDIRRLNEKVSSLGPFVLDILSSKVHAKLTAKALW